MNYAGSRIVTFGGRAMDSGNDEKIIGSDVPFFCGEEK